MEARLNIGDTVDWLNTNKESLKMFVQATSLTMKSGANGIIFV